jgi:hypothetical protein
MMTTTKITSMSVNPPGRMPGIAALCVIVCFMFSHMANPTSVLYSTRPGCAFTCNGAGRWRLIQRIQKEYDGPAILGG